MAEIEIDYFEDGKKYKAEFSDNGDEIIREGRVVGRRGYTQFNSSRPVPVTHHDDGSSTVHCGGPCGDMYVDKFGNT